MKKVLFFIICVSLMLLLVSCSSQDNQVADDTTSETVSTETSTTKTSIIDEIKERGYIVLGTSPDYAPYEFKIVRDGKEETVGFDIAIANEIANDLGVELKITEMSFNGLLLELANGNVDFVMAGLNPTEERKEAVDFSEIYYSSDQYILVNAEDTETYNTAESFENKSIGVQTSSLQEQIAKEQLPLARVTTFEKISNIILDLTSGNIDAAILESDVAKAYVSQFSSLGIADFRFELSDEGKGSAIAVKKGNTELVEQINSTLSRIQEEDLLSQFILEANELLELQ